MPKRISCTARTGLGRRRERAERIRQANAELEAKAAAEAKLQAAAQTQQQRAAEGGQATRQILFFGD